MDPTTPCTLSVEYPDPSAGESRLSPIPFDTLQERHAELTLRTSLQDMALLKRLRPGFFLTVRRGDHRGQVVAFVKALRRKSKYATIGPSGCFVDGVRTQAGVGFRKSPLLEVDTWKNDWHSGWDLAIEPGQIIDWMDAARVTRPTLLLCMVAMMRKRTSLTEQHRHKAATDDIRDFLDSVEAWARTGATGTRPRHLMPLDLVDRKHFDHLYAAAGATGYVRFSESRLAMPDGYGSIMEDYASVAAAREVVTFAQIALGGLGHPQ